VQALDMGADDYLTKPFGTDELLARVRTAIRHTRTSCGSAEIARTGTFTVGDLTIDYDKHQVLMDGKNVRLTFNEFRLVALLGKYAGKVLTYDFLIRELWGPRASKDNQILRVNMANIRRKIEKKPRRPQVYLYRGGRGLPHGGTRNKMILQFSNSYDITGKRKTNLERSAGGMKISTKGRYALRLMIDVRSTTTARRRFR
jgi:hypothetical protein